jgi:hypothetical protein
MEVDATTGGQRKRPRVAAACVMCRLSRLACDGYRIYSAHSVLWHRLRPEPFSSPSLGVRVQPAAVSAVHEQQRRCVVLLRGAEEEGTTQSPQQSREA